MLLSDFFKYLSFGELSQFNLGTDNNGAISEKDYPKIISYLNLGLTRVHTELPLKLESVIIQPNTTKDTYIISSGYGLSNESSSEPSSYFYILDQHQPYLDTLLKIQGVISESGFEYTLNDSNDDLTIYTPSYNKIQFSTPTDELVSITYRANHALLAMSRTIDPTTTTVDVPDILIEPLLTYMVSKILNNLGNAESVQEGMIYMQKFEMQLESLKNSGMFTSDLPTNNRVWSDGWV